MSSNSNQAINAAYIKLWKEKNPKLVQLETDGAYLSFRNKKIDIQNIYMQDILRNPNIFYHMTSIDSSQLFQIIYVHVYSIFLKERELEEKVRRYNSYEYTN